MSATLAPPMFLQFLATNNSGSGAVGYKLFTYAAGTTTKQATWTDSTQAIQNANPLILDGLGVGNVWIDPTLSYKFVWAPANDTDPPSSPIRTTDNIQGPLNYGLPLPSNTAMGNGAPFLSGAQLGSVGSPSSNAKPLLHFATYENATTGIGNGYVGGAGWFSCYVEGGTGFGKGLTGFTEIDGGSSISAVANHGFGVISSSVTGASVWSGWFTSHDNASSAVNQCFGIEVDLVLSASRSRVTNTIGSNAGVGIWINNQSDEVGNFHATAALGITGETNAGGLGFTSQWRTGIFIQQNAIVGGSGTHEAIQINGGSASGNRYTGVRLIGSFDIGLDLSGGTFTGTGAAILLANGGIVRAIDGSSVAQPVLLMNGSSIFIVGQGASGGVMLNNSKIGFGTTPVSLISGYGTPTGGSHQASFAAGSITLPNLAAAVAQLINDLKAYGLILA